VLLVFLFKIAIGPSYNILSSIILPPVHNMWHKMNEGS
jgi:hypothetical protein